jgi:REP element-mobilizing transposase RayT
MAAPEARVSHSYVQNIVHLVFSTKERRKLIPAEFQAALWAYVAGVCKKNDIFVYVVGGIDNHIHSLIQIPSTMTLAKTVLRIKSNSSRWAGERGQRVEWQEGYGAFSVSASNLPVVERYIRNQAAHHRKMSFEEEFAALLKKHGVEFDERYVLG